MGDQFELALEGPREAPREGPREARRVTFRRKIDCTAAGMTRDGTPVVEEPAHGVGAPEGSRA